MKRTSCLWETLCLVGKTDSKRANTRTRMSSGQWEHRRKNDSFHGGYQEGCMEEVTFDKGLEVYEEGWPGQGKDPWKWMSSGDRPAQRAWSTHRKVSPAQLFRMRLPSLWSAQCEELDCSSASFISYQKPYPHLPMSINLMGWKCLVFQWISSIYIATWVFRTLFSGPSFGFYIKHTSVITELLPVQER